MRILALGAHSDDIEIYCGGTLVKFREQGVAILGTIVTETDTDRIWEAEGGFGILGIGKPRFCEFPKAEIHNLRKLTGVIDSLIAEFSPDLILTHHTGDSHQDHVALAKAAISACRKNTISLWMCERTMLGGITDHPFRPQVFMELTQDQLNTKLKAIKSHQSQIDDMWLERVRASAIYWGFPIGRQYAEVFECVKEVR